MIIVTDLQKLETSENLITDASVKEQQLVLLLAAMLRAQMQAAGQQTDSMAELRQLREGRDSPLKGEE